MTVRTCMLGAATAGAVVLAGCGGGGSKGPSGPPAAKAGSYAGRTSQGEAVSLVVGTGAKSVSQIALKLHYKCPQGATSSESNPTGPTVALPLNGGSFNGTWVTYGVNHYAITGSVAGGSAHGTISGHFPAEIGSGTCLSGNVTWQALLSNAGASQTTPAATTTTTTGLSQGRTARDELTIAVSLYNRVLHSYAARAHVDSRANNLPAFQSDAAGIRTGLYNFDAAVRKMSFPPSAGSQVNALLGADKIEIADLDGVGAAKGPSAAVSMWNRAVADNRNTVAAVGALRAAL